MNHTSDVDDRTAKNISNFLSAETGLIAWADSRLQSRRSCAKGKESDNGN